MLRLCSKYYYYGIKFLRQKPAVDVIVLRQIKILKFKYVEKLINSIA